MRDEKVRIMKEQYFQKHEYPKFWVKAIREKKEYLYEECIKFIDLLEVKRGEIVLEIGTGEGRFVPLVTNKGGHYIGVDVSKDMLNCARDYIKEGNVDLILCEAKFLPFKQKAFDKCFCYATIFFIPHQERVISEIVRVCKTKALIEFRNIFSPQILQATISARLRIRAQLKRILSILLLCCFTSYVTKKLLRTFYGEKATKFLIRISAYKNIRPILHLPPICPYFPLTPVKILRILKGLPLKSSTILFSGNGQIVKGRSWFFKPFLIVEIFL
jgi:ubiquinone/menaquinone biosynthesis C-methylase UbiE